MTKTIEKRVVDAKIEVRSNPDGTTGVRGYAAVFESEAHGEIVKRSAFNRTIAQRDNVRFLINHEGTPLASTRGGTMTVGVDDHGLWFDIASLDMANPRAQEFVSATGRGDMYQCSFAGYWRDAPVVAGLREVREVELIDVSGVTYPWYEDTAMSLTGNRHIDKSLISVRSLTPVARRELVAEALRAAPPGESSYGDLANELCDQICTLLSVGGAEPWVFIDDMGADWAVYSLFDGDSWDFYQIPYTLAADGTITVGTPFEVEVVTEYRPLTPAQIAAEDPPMRTLSVAEARALLANPAA